MKDNEGVGTRDFRIGRLLVVETPKNLFDGVIKEALQVVLFGEEIFEKGGLATAAWAGHENAGGSLEFDVDLSNCRKIW